MEAQLDFTWNYEPVVWKPAPITRVEEERYELPQQLDFRLADLPAIPSDLPAPMAFTNGGKKLIQYPGVQKSKPKSQSFSKPVSFKKPQKPAKVQKSVNKPMIKPEWNTQLSNVGLFDPGISKKLPIEIQHAMKKDQAFPKRPNFYQDPETLPQKKSKTNPSKSFQSLKIEENLDVKFISNQEEIVKNLEKQLEREKIARKKLDEQFAQKMKEMEKATKKIKGLEQAIITPETKKAAFKPSPDQILRQDSIQRFSPHPKSDLMHKIGDIHEVPTRDIGPMVLKANTNKPKAASSKAQDPKPSHQTLKTAQTVFSESEPQQIHPRTITPTDPALHPRSKPLFQSFDMPENDPVLNSLTAAMVKYRTANEYSGKSSGIISQVGAKYIAFYANELAEMLIDDFLEDTVYDLQRIETKKTMNVHSEFTKEAETHFQTIVKEFEQETRVMQNKHLGTKKKELVLERILQDSGDDEIVIEDKRREWNVEIDDEVIGGIRKYKKQYEEFQRVFSGGADGKLWEVYAVIGDDIVDEILKEVAKEYEEGLDEFTERFMNNEFA